MKTFISYLFVIASVVLFANVSYGQSGETVEKGRESAKGSVDFSELAKYKLAHPDPLVRMDIEDDDDDIPHPVVSPIHDTSLIKRKAPARSGLPVPSLPASPGPLDSFESTKDPGTTIPPDTHGAVDTNYCVTSINTNVKIQTKIGGAVSSVTLNSFFSAVNPANGTFDPRTHYDPYTNRWIIVCVSGANNTSDTTSILIAVSKTSNPTGSWWLYRVRAFSAATYWLDFPDVGFNGKWLTVTGNLFQNSPGTGYGGAKVFVFDKAALLAGTGATYTAFTQASSFTIAPSINYDASNPNMWGIESWNGTLGAMNLWKITGSVGSETMSHIAYPVSPLHWDWTSNLYSGTAGGDFAPQTGTSNLVQTNDDRVDQMVFMNGYLWFAHTVFLPYTGTTNPTRSSVQWWQIDSTGTPQQVGSINDPASVNFFAFPTLAVNTNNDLLIGCATMSSTTHPSAAYAVRLHTDPLDSLRPPFTYRAGLGTYYKTFSGTKNRWGDYSAAALDPINQRDFWTIQEASTLPANTWDTYWAHVVMPAPITGTTSVCAGSATTLTDATSGGTWTSSTTTVATVVSGTGVVTGVTAGTTTITYTISNGLYAVTTYTVNAAPAAISGATIACVGLTTGLSDAVTGGTWASSSTSIATISSGGLVTGVSSGTSTITYTLSSGCNVITTVTINSTPSAISGTLTVCAGSTTTLSDAGGGTWSSSTSSVATVVSGTGVVTGVSAGTSTITYSLGAGCTATAVVTVNAIPNTITGTLSVCVGLTTSLSDVTGGGTWTSSTSSVATIVSGSGVLTGVSAGTSTIAYKLTATGCQVTAIATVNALPNAIVGTTSVCAGLTTGLSDVTGGGTWTSGTSSVATVVSGTGVVTGVAAGTSTITYTITATGCTTTTLVTVNPSPSAISGTLTVCAGLTTTLSDVGGGTWSSGTTTVATVISGTGVVTGVSGGTSTITYTISAGCTATAVVTVNPLPAAITGATGVCVGSSSALSDASGGGTWASSNTSVATVGLGSGLVNGLSAGTSVITYTLSTGCLITTTVTVNSLPSAITGTTSVCVGATTALSDAGGGTWTSGTTTVATVVSGTGVVTGVLAGTATITYTLGIGCAVSTVVTVNPVPSGVSGTLTVCAGLTTSLSDATGGGTWTSGSTTVATVVSGTGVVTGVSAGSSTITYTVTATGCTATAIVTVNPLPVAISGSLSVCNGLTTGLSDVSGGGTWTSGTTTVATVVTGTGVVTGASAGTSTITYTLGTGCLITGVVTVNPLPFAIGGTKTVCVGLTTGLSDITGGGTWSSGATTVATVVSGTGIVTGASAGTATITYAVTVTGCTTTTVVTVNPLPAAITGTMSVCVGLTTALTDAGGGTWASGSTSVATVAGTGVVTGAAAGTSVITYTLPTGCLITATVAVNPLPTAITGTASVCAGLTTALSDAGGGTWTSGTTTVATVGLGTGVVTGAAAGTSTITYTAGAGCTATLVVTVNPLPATITGTSNVCVGLTTALTDAGGGTWLSSNTSVATISGTGVVTGVSSGTSVITYTLATGCITTTPVTVNPLPAAISGASSVCTGASVTLSDGGGGAWTSSNTTVATIGLGTGLLNGLTAGSTTITYTLSTGCLITRPVTVYLTPVAITGTTVMCAGLTTTLSDASGAGAWTSSTTTIATVGAGTGVVTGVAGGTSTITYTLAGGCNAVKVVTVNPLPAAITGSTSVCAGLTTPLSDATGGGTWTSSTTTVATVVSGSGTVTGVTVGTTTITYTLTASGCITTTTFTVNLVPSAIAGVPNVCAGSTTGLSDATGGGTWTSSATTIATVVSGSGLVTGVAAGTASITYTLGAGCTTVSTVTVNPLPSAITGATNVCAGLTTSLTDAGGGTWASGNTSVAAISAGGVVTGVLAGTAAITYTLPTGCAATTLVTVNPLPSAITGTANVCVGQTTALTDAGGGNWTSSNTLVATVSLGTGVVNGVLAGTATITYTLGTGCIITTPVTVNPLPGAITGTTTICAATSATLSDAGGGTWTSSNTVIATVGLGTGVVTGVVGGTVTITYALATGCITTTLFTINPLPGAITGVTDVCVGLTTILNDVGGGTWTSSNTSVATVVAGSGTVTGVTAGTAAITYTLPTGCTTSTIVTVNALPPAITGMAVTCVGTNTTLSDAGGGTWSSSNTSVATIDPSLGILSGLSGGTTTITYSLGTGCIATTLATVNPLPSAITGTAFVCVGLTTTLSDASAGGTWTSGNTTVATIDPSTALLSGLVAGTSEITYTLGTGCFITTTATVNPLPSAITGTFTVCPGLTAALTDAGGGSWTSGNTAAATIGVGSGIVTGVAQGTTTITYTLGTGCTTTATFTVNGLPVVTSITGATAVCAGLTIALTDATTGGTWSSSNTTIATVTSGGVVTGMAGGVVNISYAVTNVCGTTAPVYAVTVNPLPVVAAITGTPNVCIAVTTALSDATPSGVWTSSNTSVATISSSGVVTGVAAGTTTVSYTVTSAFGCISGVATVVTVNPPLSITITPASSTSFCTGGFVMLNSTTGTGYSYQWQVGGFDISGATSSGYLVNYSGSFDVVVTGPGICRSVSPAVTVTVSPSSIVVPAVTITASPDTILCLTSSPVTFTPNPVNGGTPVYQWYVNGLAMATGSTFVYSPLGGDIIKVRMTSNATCVFPDTAIGSVTMIISPLQTPSVNITSSQGDTICQGTYTTFTANPLFGGSVPTYVWKKNGVSVSTGVSYGYIPVAGDVLVCTMTSNYPCVTSVTAVSPSLHLNVEALSVNKDSIYVTKSFIMTGEIDTFVAIAPHGGASPAYQWYVNGVAVPGETAATFITTALVDGQVVSCTVTSSDPCTSPKTGTSNSLKVRVGSDVNTLGTTKTFTLVPNPNKGTFTISGTLKNYTDGEVSIVITDMLGQNIYRKVVVPQGGTVDEHIVLDKSIANAMYLVKVAYGDDYQVFHVVVDR